MERKSEKEREKERKKDCLSSTVNAEIPFDIRSEHVAKIWQIKDIKDRERSKTQKQKTEKIKFVSKILND